MSDLPDGWEIAEFGQLTINHDGKRVPIKASDRASRQGEYRYFGAQGVIDHIAGYIYDGTYLLIAEDGANLVSRTQPIAQIASGKFWVNNHAHVVQAAEGISLKYLMHFMNGNPLTGAIRGSAQPKLTQGDLNKLKVPVPSSLEQTRIVAAIDEQFSRLDAGITALKRVQINTTRLQSAAVESALAAGRRQEWPVAHLETVAEVSGGITKSPKRFPRTNCAPFLRVANVLRSELDLMEIHQVELFPGDLERYRLQRGDLLVVEGNGSPDQIGRSALWDGSIDPCVHQNHLIRVRPGKDIIPEYLNIFWNAPSTAAKIQSVAASTSGLHTLSTGKVRKIEVILPPLEDQLRIVSDANRQTSALRDTDRQLAMAFARSKSLRNSIFSSAFSGALTSKKAFA